MIHLVRQTSGCMEDRRCPSKKGETEMAEMEYEVIIREVLERKVKCRAPDEQQAVDRVQARYQAGEIILDAEDFAYKEFDCHEMLPVMERAR